MGEKNTSERLTGSDEKFCRPKFVCARYGQALKSKCIEVYRGNKINKKWGENQQENRQVILYSIYTG